MRAALAIAPDEAPLVTCRCGNVTTEDGVLLFRCGGECGGLWREQELLGTYIGHSPTNKLVDNPMSCPQCDGVLSHMEYHLNEDCADFEQVTLAPCQADDFATPEEQSK